MGYIEEIDQMDLSDEVKSDLKAKYLADTRPQRVAGYRSEADEFVQLLSDAGLEKAPGFLKRIRRIMMSEDAHEPAAILMSDAELGLTGDEATGATGREEVTLAQEIKALFSLLPGFQEKKLKIDLGAMALADEAGVKPDDGGDPTPDEKTKEARTNLRRVTGQAGDGAPVMTRKRYRRSGHVVATGGDN